jgi:ribulose-bisphosphate carboxylase large chain
MSRVIATYRVQSDASAIEARARAIAVEQSVEMPLDAIMDGYVLSEIVGRVESIDEASPGAFTVRISLSAETFGRNPAQLMNMLFGNASIFDGVEFVDVQFPDAVAGVYAGPNLGIAGLRKTFGAGALTCTALKPQGLPPEKLADLARQFAHGGVQIIKDDHGLGDQAYSPFEARVSSCAKAVRDANTATGGRTQYALHITGTLDDLRKQIRFAKDEGIGMVLIAPMLTGLPAFHAVVSENPDMAFMTHPAMGGAARIAPPLLFGKLFRMLGSDATVFVNYGGRFSYTPHLSKAVADAARQPWHGYRACMPVPAGGMTTDRVPELLDFYGPDVMLLIGGNLLQAREKLVEKTAAFVEAVAAHRFTSP